MATWFWDYVNGNDSNNGTSWALAKQSCAGVMGLALAAGDTVRIAKSADPIDTTHQATWVSLQKYITLDSAVSQLLDDCESGWTAKTNVTVTYDSSSFKSGTKAMQLVTNASFTTGQLATQPVNAGTGYNLSAYQQLSFWLFSTAIISTSVLQVILYSDTACTSVVATFNVPAITGTSVWTPITIDLGSGLSSTVVKGIAIVAASTFTSKTVKIDNINACLAPSNAAAITLQTLLSKTSTVGQTEGWYGIQSLNGTQVYLDNDQGATPTQARGYWSATSSATVELYKRETIKSLIAIAQQNNVHNVTKGGSSSGQLTFSGGWNTSSTLQDGETWFDGTCGWGFGFNSSSTFLTFDRIGMVRFYNGFSLNGASQVFGSIYASNNSNTGVTLSSSDRTQITQLVVNNNSGSGSPAGGLAMSKCELLVITAIYAMNGRQTGITLQSSSNITISNLYTCNNNPVAVSTASIVGLCVKNGYARSNATTVFGQSLVQAGSPQTAADIFLYNFETDNNTAVFAATCVTCINCLFNEATVASIDANHFGRITSTDHQQTGGSYQAWEEGATWFNETATRHTASGNAWEIQFTGATAANRTTLNPVKFPIARVALASGIAATVSVWVNQDDASKIACSLICPGMQPGVAADVVTNGAASTGWQQLTITVTPTENCVVDIFVYAWYVSGTANLYVDDFSVSQ